MKIMEIEYSSVLTTQQIVQFKLICNKSINVHFDFMLKSTKYLNKKDKIEFLKIQKPITKEILLNYDEKNPLLAANREFSLKLIAHAKKPSRKFHPKNMNNSSKRYLQNMD